MSLTNRLLVSRVTPRQLGMSNYEAWQKESGQAVKRKLLWGRATTKPTNDAVTWRGGNWRLLERKGCHRSSCFEPHHEIEHCSQNGKVHLRLPGCQQSLYQCRHGRRQWYVYLQSYDDKWPQCILHEWFRFLRFYSMTEHSIVLMRYHRWKR